jgi:hypothetical protein
VLQALLEFLYLLVESKRFFSEIMTPSREQGLVL